MNKASRYMREYASSIKKSAEGRKKDLGHVNDDVWDDTIIKADRIVRNYENGSIIEREAMQLLAELCY